MWRVLLILLAYTAAGSGCAKGGSSTPDAVDARRAIPIDAAADSNGCAVQPCSILPQCGCNGPNACDASPDDTGTTCRSILRPGTETSTCTASTGCDGGYACIGGSAYASCKKYCTDDVDCGSPRGKCVLQQTRDGMAIPGVPRMCTSNCIPTDTTPEQCPSTFKCTLFTARTLDGMTHKIADCSLAGTGTQGTDCTAGGQPYEARCAKGYQCVKLSNETVYKCRKICTNPSANSSQCNNMQCLGYSEPHTIAGVTYGVCLP